MYRDKSAPCCVAVYTQIIKVMIKLTLLVVACLLRHRHHEVAEVSEDGLEVPIVLEHLKQSSFSRIESTINWYLPKCFPCRICLSLVENLPEFAIRQGVLQSIFDLKTLFFNNMHRLS